MSHFIWNITSKIKNNEIYDETIDIGIVTQIYVAEILQIFLPGNFYLDKFIYLNFSTNEVIWNKMFPSSFILCKLRNACLEIN